MMSSKQKGIPTVFAIAMVTLLSCCFSPVSSYFALPRVSRTSDAIIIDYEGVGYSPFSLGRGYGQIVDSGFIPLPAIDPYTMEQPQPMFYNGWSSHFGRNTPPACGRGPVNFPRSLSSERIAGGTAATSGAWPFLVLLRKTTDAAGVFFCSGTLIHESRVLLAAQCLEKLSVYEISTVTILIGGFNAALTDVPMTRRISRVVIHGGYNAANYANDIAIITLDMPVVLSLKVSTVCTAQQSADVDQYVDQPAIVLGWDTPAPPAQGGRRRRRQLQQGLVAISSFDDCKNDGTIKQFVTTNTTCVTSGANNNIFTCSKDIGGPVLVNTAPATPGTRPVFTQVGINSYTRDCTRSSLKTRVAAYADWIKTHNPA